MQSPRSERSPRDMALSLAVLLVPIALLLGFYRVVLDGDRPVTVDASPAVAQARSAHAFPVSEPPRPNSDWQVTSARHQRVDGGQVLRVGYLTPDGGGVQLLQSNVPVQRLLPAELGAQARAAGTVQAGTRTWQRYEARPGEQALVLLEPARTVIVVGAAHQDELHRLAAALP